jgi:hypothetical protein
LNRNRIENFTLHQHHAGSYEIRSTLSHIASTFCLDTKSSKEIKAPEKWLKISRAAFRRRTRFIDANNL